MIGLEYDGSFPPTTMSDEALGVDEFATQQANRPFQLPLNQEGVDDLLLNGSYEQLPAHQQQQTAAPILPPVHVVPVSTIPAASSSVSSTFVPVAAASPSWEQTVATNGNKRHAPVERETKVKKRKQQHQLKDKERRHRINDGLKQLGNLVQGATGSFTRLDQPTIVSSSISLIKQLQAELNMLRSQLGGQKPTTKDVKEEKFVSKPADSGGRHHADGACPVFASVAGAGVGLINIRADDLSIVEANSVLANILGYASAVEFVGTAVWDAPLHSRLYQLDAHGRIVNDNSNPFAIGASQPKVKLEGQDGAVVEEEQHIDCLWTAHTANGNMLSAKVTLSVLKGDDAKPTHFMLCSLPSHRSVSPLQPSVSAFPTTSMPAEVEVAC